MRETAPGTVSPSYQLDEEHESAENVPQVTLSHGRARS